MFHWYVKPEIHLSCDLPSTRSRKIEQIYCELVEEGILTHRPSICLPLPAFSEVGFMHMCVNIPVMHKKIGVTPAAAAGFSGI